MRLLFVHDNYFPYIGGIETQHRLIAKRLAQRHSVTVAAVNFSNTLTTEQSISSNRATHLPAAIARLGQHFKNAINSTLLGPYNPGYLEEKVLVQPLTPPFSARLRPAMAALVKRGYNQVSRSQDCPSFQAAYFDAARAPLLQSLAKQCDILHCTSVGPLGLLSEKVARSLGVPFVLTPYVHPDQGGEDPQSRAFYRSADVVFALLESDRDILVRCGVPRDRIKLIGVVPLLPKATDPDAFRIKHSLVGRPVVLFIGRLVRFKGCLALLEAAPLVWQELPDVHFIFAGPEEDPVRPRFNKISDPRIKYLGVISEQEKGDALAACDLFCMPSKGEILPAVYLEAWSYGKPVIGGTAHGLRELIEGNAAGLVVEQDPKSLARHIIDLIRDEPQRRALGNSGKALVERRFTEDRVVQAFEDGYRFALEITGRRSDLVPAATAEVLANA